MTSITCTYDDQVQLVIHIRSQVKTRQSQSYKFKKNAKNSNFEILQEILHATHLLKLLDKMHKYEMDPIRTVGATERTRDAGRTRDGWTDGQTEWNQYTPQQLRCIMISYGCMASRNRNELNSISTIRNETVKQNSKLPGITQVHIYTLNTTQS